MTRIKVISVLALFLCAVLPCLAQSKTAKAQILFTIDEKPVYTDEFIYLYTKNHQGNEKHTEKQVSEYLDLFVNFKLKVEEAKSRGMDTTQAFHTELNSYKIELKKPYLAEKDQLDQLVREAYERMKEEIRASHILISIKPDASPADTLKAYERIMELRKRVASGEDFEALAKEFSEDPSAKSNGGDLGYFSVLQMVFPFEDAAYQLAVGEVSQPVRTRFGYHLLKVKDRIPSRGEVEVSHILIRGDTEEAKKKVYEAFSKLNSGEDWGSLCKTYSEDPATKEKGGRLRPFAPGALASAPQFEKVAFSLSDPGSISSPFQTQYGWHIIRFEKAIPLPSFEDLEEALRRRVARDDRLQIAQSIVEEKRKKKFAFSENAVVKNELIKQADSTLTKGKWKIQLSQSDANNILFTLGNKPVLVKEWITFVLQNQSGTNMDPKQYLDQLYDRFVQEKLNEAEDEALQREQPEYRNLVKEYSEGILLFGIMEEEVWNKASADSLGQRSFYEANKGAYHADDRVNARIFATDNKAFRDKIKTKIAAGDSIGRDDLKQFKSIQNFRAYEKGESKIIDAVEWTIGLHETEDGGMYYLVEIERLVPPGPRSFDEARAMIISDYQDHLEKKWIVQLKEKYKVRMNKRGVQEVEHALISK